MDQQKLDLNINSIMLKSKYKTIILMYKIQYFVKYINIYRDVTNTKYIDLNCIIFKISDIIQ